MSIVRQPMDELLTGHYWKTPFLWESGCPEPSSTQSLRFEPIAGDRLVSRVAEVLASSADPSDRHAVVQHGEQGAARELISFAPEYFRWSSRWWQSAHIASGDEIGFVLPVVFKDPQRSKEGCPQGSIFYMGTLPRHRNMGYSLALLAEATRILIAAKCWRIFCDTGTENVPMVKSFRRAGYMERAPWQRPVA
jgi:ribosomal protein S18 acetylase RimI-like enzyme